MILSFLANPSAAEFKKYTLPFTIIYPGEGVGKVRFETKLSEVIKILKWGKPDKTYKDKTTNEYNLIYIRRGVAFVFSEDKNLSNSILSKITFTRPAYMVA